MRFVALIVLACLLVSADTRSDRDRRELFLETARIEKKAVITAGTTHPWRVTMTDGTLTHDAQVQYVNVYMPLFKAGDYQEKNFRDTYKFNIAAYLLDKMLDLNMVPITVERQVDGKWGAVTWWIDNVLMTEEQRRKQKVQPPNLERWVDQLNKVRVFDQLIYNTDRNQGNLLIDKDWKLWMIDHTRAFRAQPTLRDPKQLLRCDFQLFQKLLTLDSGAVRQAMRPYLRDEETEALLKRRDAIVQHFRDGIQQRGEDEMLSGMPRSTPKVSVP